MSKKCLGLLTLLSEKKYILLLLLAVVGGCTSLQQPGRDPEKELAERSIVARKTELLERENHVIREDNMLLQKENATLKARIDTLQEEIKVQREKNLSDNTLWQKKYSNLEEQFKVLQSESGGRIRQLTELHAQQEKKFTEELRAQKELLQNEQLQWAREREELRKQLADLEFKSAREIYDLKENEKELKRELSAARQAQETAQKENAELLKRIATLEAQRDELQNRLKEALQSPPSDK